TNGNRCCAWSGIKSHPRSWTRPPRMRRMRTETSRCTSARAWPRLESPSAAGWRKGPWAQPIVSGVYGHGSGRGKGQSSLHPQFIPGPGPCRGTSGGCRDLRISGLLAD
ncbi:hypothetical protein G5576_116289, partial [Homo sapiens]